jgi:hypothetical protein
MQRGSDRTDIGKKGAFSARFRPTGRMNRGPGRHRKIIGPVAGGSTSAPTKAAKGGASYLLLARRSKALWRAT